jgi:molybdopterin/thiamine biosynthesis adenylyltransferase
MKEHPSQYNKFIFKNWKDFEKLMSNDFLNYLHKFDKQYIKKYEGKLVPIFIGYETINNEIHWQVSLIKIGEFPVKGEAEIFLGTKTGKWNSKLIDKNIQWAITRNASYKYFFGRGTLNPDITEKKILIIGVGAIGSMVAKTLTRCGSKYIDIADYDVKEPENVCRSEYMFHYGLEDKVTELQNILCLISPFIEINIIKKEYFELISKTHYKNLETKEILARNLDEYDIVFDCTTDDDLMHILNSLNLKCNVINLSITNHAEELVCGFYPNIYNFVNTQFQSILKNDLEDLYEPIGCWSPTFKASYNDINILVQFAIKHINSLYEENLQKNNFIVQYDEKKLKLEIKEY